ncbi:hypothetical protein COU58_00475 [Candidatus Pacearchaeota archaeon CG10_big_fil_rev_8_21_14_0_10_32_42]|nr:MAG: hypothetical protein COU58_00475 [Candidatus Pacearchaeota archaeon CG10_big_fil_rev_8_21_14_0_10_32_42]
MNKEKIMTYGLNIATNPVVNLTGLSKYVGNPGNLYGAAFYGALDLIGMVSPKFEKSTFTGLVKAVGAGTFVIKSIGDLASIVNGEYSPAFDFVFDASMAYQLGKDTFSIYGKGARKKDILEDCVKVKDVFKKSKGAKGTFKKIGELFTK